MLRVEVRGGDPEGIADFILRRLDQKRANLKLFQALGAYQDKTLLGGFLYTNYRPIADGMHSIDMHMAGEPGWLTRAALRAFYAYPFLQLGCSRVIGGIRADNARARRTAERMGCRLDGVIRSGISEGFDTCVYTMIRADCPWL